MKPPRQAGLILAGILGLASPAAFGQMAPTNRVVPRQTPRTVAVPGETPISSDVFNSMVASASSFDMDSPVETKAEFDPPMARAGGQIVYRVVVTALDESLKVPDELPLPAGLKLQPGGRGQVYEPSGGMRIRPQTTINYHVLAPTNGEFTIPAFQVMAYGKPVDVPAATLKVTADAPAQDAPRLWVQLPAEDVYVGEALAVPLALPIAANGAAGMSSPRVTGELVFSEPLYAAPLRQETLRRDGRNVPAYVQNVLVTPLREGPLEIIGQAYAILSRPVPNLTNVFQTVTELVDSGPVTLVVKPLPVEGQLPGFTGAVGVLQLDPPRLSTNSVRAGEPVVLTVVIHGSGNLGRLTPPPPPARREWQAFPPIGDAVPPAFIQQRGYVVFNYTLIPLSDQIKATPAIPFSYFDPKKKTYMDITIPPVAVTVKPSGAGALAALPPVTAAPKPEGDDDSAPREREPVLTGLAEKPGGTAAGLTPVQQQAWFWGLQLVLAAGLSGLWAWDRRRRHLEEHPEVVLKRRARRGLSRQLRLARRAASARDAAGFVSSAANALREACAPHGAANPSALVCADVLRELPEPERAGRAGEMVRRLFAAADASRFGGPVKEGPELLSLEPELEQVLEGLRGRL